MRFWKKKSVADPNKDLKDKMEVVESINSKLTELNKLKDDEITMKSNRIQFLEDKIRNINSKEDIY